MNSRQILKKNVKYSSLKKFIKCRRISKKESLPSPEVSYYMPSSISELVDMGQCLFYLDGCYDKDVYLSFFTTNVDKWKSVSDELSDLFTYLTSKRISFEFIPRDYPPTQQMRLFGGYEDPRAISLLSGGVDSYVGGKILIQNNLNVSFSHSFTNNHLLALVRNLFSYKFPKKDIVLYEVNAKFREGITSPLSQTRTLLFILNSIPLLDYHNGDTIILPENGPLQLNLKLGSRISATRTTRPEFLLGLSKFLSDYLERKVKVFSPFSNNTKSEMIQSIDNKQSVQDTYSCYYTRFNINCGVCFSCFVRQLSNLAINIYEPRSTYKNNPLTFQSMPPSSQNKRDFLLLLTFMDFFDELLSGAYQDIENNSTIYSASLCGINKPVELLKRFAIDMLLGIKNYYNHHSYDKSRFIVGRRYLDIVSTYGEEIIDNRLTELESFKPIKISV